MSKTKIIFVRHGQTDQNLAKRAGEAIKEENFGLNRVGIEQVEETSVKLKDCKVAAIISSPLKRALQTAEIINKHHNLPIIVDDRLHERKGGFITREQWPKMFNMDDPRVDDGNEYIKDFFQRIYDCIDDLVEKYDGKTILVVAHGGVHHAFYAYCKNLPWKGNMRISRVENGEAREYEMEKDE